MINVQEYKEIMIDCRRRMQESGAPEEYIEGLEMVVQIRSDIPEVGGYIGFLKYIDEEQDMASILILCPAISDITRQACLELEVPLETLTMIGTTVDTLASGISEEYHDYCPGCGDYPHDNVVEFKGDPFASNGEGPDNLNLNKHMSWKQYPGSIKKSEKLEKNKKNYESKSGNKCANRVEDKGNKGDNVTTSKSNVIPLIHKKKE
jgi:hypothetical protein